MTDIPQQPTDCHAYNCGKGFMQERVFFCRVNGRVCHLYEQQAEAAAEREIDDLNKLERD